MTTANSNWIIDASHSQVQFKVKHLAVANVTGIFKVFGGEVESFSEDFSGAKVNVTIDVDSIDTNNSERDNHLKSELFFDGSVFPVITFRGMLQKEIEDYILGGELTIHGVTQTIKLSAELTGIGKGRFGDERAGFEISGKINRKDYGLTWSMVTEAGSLIVGEEIKLHFDIELIRK
jgi:polyisoprenoid-binding protein YceI